MKNIFFIFLLTFYPFNLIAADYSKLPTIQEKLFNHKQIDLACFKDEKYLGLLDKEEYTAHVSSNKVVFDSNDSETLLTISTCQTA